jgi:hypothetical protein
VTLSDSSALTGSGVADKDRVALLPLVSCSSHSLVRLRHAGAQVTGLAKDHKPQISFFHSIFVCTAENSEENLFVLKSHVSSLFRMSFYGISLYLIPPSSSHFSSEKGSKGGTTSPGFDEECK